MTAPLAQPADRNLRLAVLDRLMSLGVLPSYAGPAATDEYAYDDAVAEALLATPVSAAQAARATSVTWEAGGNEVLFTIWEQWDGETGEFTVTSLAGVDTLPGLEELAVHLCAVTDLGPLAGCAGLRALSLEGGFGVTDLSPLAGLTALRTLRLNHLLDPRVTDPLGPLAGLALTELDLSTNGAGLVTEPLLDFAPLERLTSLRTLRFGRTVRAGGREPGVLTAFDNARVLAVLRDRGTTVEIS